jgi:hypothetical protein
MDNGESDSPPEVNFPPLEEPCTNPDCYLKLPQKELNRLKKSKKWEDRRRLVCVTCNSTNLVLTPFGEAVLDLVFRRFEVPLYGTPATARLAYRSR